ncbi:unnamed protein product [Cyclocybe aegerita]|uniref:Uncharacterized protein n=1 Tax=Cyclocybe aegerita TaxID=1973307 RepID=A0A8S0VZ16_CYCAE|nr:unnamed protein product [Cyclocybe aegerita]
MVVPSPLTHDQLFAQLETQYHHKFVPASALFWTHNGQHAMRLEVPRAPHAGVQRQDDDPEGYLFYNHVEDLDLERGTRYVMFPNTYRTKQDHAAVVQFFHNDPSKCYAQLNNDQNIPRRVKGFVDFNPDRVLFYPKQMNPEFTAIFIPSEAIKMPDALGTASVETQTVEWSNI